MAVASSAADPSPLSSPVMLQPTLKADPDEMCIGSSILLFHFDLLIFLSLSVQGKSLLQCNLSAMAAGA